MTGSISDKGARAVGARIHRLVVAEGGMLAHYGGGSRFVKRDAATGEWTSACLSDGVKALIRAHRDELRVYAAARRREMDGWPVVDKLSTGHPHTPVGSSGAGQTSPSETRRTRTEISHGVADR